MALYDSADLLQQFNELAGRPTSNDSIADAAKYQRLSRAQQAVIGDMMPVVPKSLYPKVPYTMFPQAAPNAQTDGAGTLVISGASFAAGATLTLTASTANFASTMVGQTVWAVDPSTLIPLALLITGYTGTTIVSATATVTIPTSMRTPTALAGWSIETVLAPDGQVFTFGFNGNGYPIMPMGKAIIFPSLASWPDFPWVEGMDYISEGTQIRMPNNRTWASPLYWYGVPQPSDISASVQPALFPEGSRELIVFRAVANFANEADNNEKLSAKMEGRYQQAWMRWCTAWKTQFGSGGALGSISGLRIAMMGGQLNGVNFSSAGGF